MRLRILLAVVLLIALSGMAFALESPKASIPAYPGSEVGMEINMSNADILPMIKAMAPLLTGKTADIFQKINPDDLAAIFKDVSRIELIQFDVGKSGVTEQNIAYFYLKNVPEGKWSRVFWQTNPKTGIIGAFVQEGMSGVYGFKIESARIDGKLVRKGSVLKLSGKIDFQKVLELAAKVALPSPTAQTNPPAPSSAPAGS